MGLFLSLKRSKFTLSYLASLALVVCCVGESAFGVPPAPASQPEAKAFNNGGCYEYNYKIDLRGAGRKTEGDLVSKGAGVQSCVDDKLASAYRSAFDGVVTDPTTITSLSNEEVLTRLQSQQTLGRGGNRYVQGVGYLCNDDDGCENLETDNVFMLEFVKNLETLMGLTSGSLVPRLYFANDDTRDPNDQVAGGYNVNELDWFLSDLPDNYNGPDRGGNCDLDSDDGFKCRIASIQMSCDSSCNCTKNDDAELCDFENMTIRASYSPLSLVWMPGSNEAVVSNFPLESGKSENWYIWEGSAARPLVVYDPNKTGKITGPEQLFGNHTKGEKWSDGFEALKSFDKDMNGRVEGDELASISLWFDRNQSGVSDAGEVKDIRAEGVVALFYQNSTLTSDGNLALSLGYERKGSEEQVVKGQSIDWHSKAYASREKALAAIETKKLMAKRDSYQRFADKNVNSKFTGVWQWEVDSDGKVEGNGIKRGTLALVANNNGMVSGSSVIEIPVTNAGKDMSLIRTAPFDGKVSSGSPNEFSFKVFGQDGLVTETTAKIVDEGKVLKGASRSYVMKDGKVIKEGSHYNWTAKRFSMKESKNS